MDGAAEKEFRGTERFLIESRLGEGGFGVVYRAFDRKRNAVVALKTLRRWDPAALYRFKQEFRSLTDVTHANLVMLYELLSDGEEWFFTMELIDGVDLLDYVREHAGAPHPGPKTPSMLQSAPDFSTTPTLDANTQQLDLAGGFQAAMSGPALASPADLDRLRDAFAQLSEGVMALHEMGMLHRDIKPSNVLVTGEGRVVLLDFGLTSEVEPADTPLSVHIVGTPTYMSPEQGAGKPVTEAGDWYSVGVMLYEALTGRLPFSGPLLEVMMAKQRYDAPPPGDLVSGLPEDLESLCGDLLRREPQARPRGAEVLRRLGGVRSGTRPLAAPPAERRSAPFVGRERQLADLNEAFQATKEGRGVTVWLHGPSGMGKSALVRRFLRDLRQRDRQVVLLVGRCYERESVPYKAVDSLIDALAQHLKRLPELAVERILPHDVLALARLFPVLREVEAISSARRRVLEIADAQELRRRAFAALRELLVRLSDHNPVALFIDDLQWGDLDSGALLAEVMRPPDPPALLLLASYRSEEAAASPLLRMLAPASGAGPIEARQVAVGELTAAEAGAVALEILGGQDPESIERAQAIARESGGSPFFVEELARYRPQEGETAAATLEEVLHRRVSRLPDRARRFLEVVAVAGQPLGMQAAATAAELESEEHLTVGILRSGHLVRTRARAEVEEIETYHDRIRESVVAHLPAETLRRHHGRLAAALEGVGGADPEVLAVHFQGAEEFGRAARYAIEAAGKAAEALAFERAARLYRMALELSPPGGAAGRDLQAKLGEALVNAGRGAEAARSYLAAAEGAEPPLRLEFTRRAGEQFLISGHIDEGLDVLRTVLGIIGMKLAGTPQRALLSLLARRAQIWFRGLKFEEREAAQVPAELLTRIDTCWSTAVGLAVVDPIRSCDFQSRHLLLALQAGEPYRIARALAMEVAYYALGGGRNRIQTEKLIRKAMELAERVGNPHALGLVMIMSETGRGLLEGRYDRRLLERVYEAERILREQCTGVAWELDTAQIFSLQWHFWLGEWQELARRVPVLIKEAQERGDLYVASYLRTRSVYLTHLMADDPARAREEERRGAESWSQKGFHIQHYWDLLAQGEIDLYCGEARPCWERIQKRWPDLKRSLLSRLHIFFIESRHLRARGALAMAAAGGDVALLGEAERAVRALEKQGAPWGNALAGLIRAGVAATRGDRETAAALAARAEKGFEDTLMAGYAAAARRRRGELIGGEEGTALIASADAWMSSQRVKNPARMAAMLAPGRWS